MKQGVFFVIDASQSDALLSEAWLGHRLRW
jgi:hypothetical protein